MKTVLDTVASLREILLGMERDLGLSDLTRNEMDVLCAISRLNAASCDPIRSELIRAHPLVCHMSQPTYNRTLKGLLAKGYVAQAPDGTGGKYVPGPKLAAS